MNDKDKLEEASKKTGAMLAEMGWRLEQLAAESLACSLENGDASCARCGRPITLLVMGGCRICSECLNRQADQAMEGYGEDDG